MSDRGDRAARIIARAGALWELDGRPRSRAMATGLTPLNGMRVTLAAMLALTAGYVDALSYPNNGLRRGQDRR